MRDAAIHRVSGDASGDYGLLPCSFLSSPFHLKSSIFQTFLDDPSFHACEETEVGLNDGS